MKLAITQQNTVLTHLYMYVSSLATKTGNALRAFPATTLLPLCLVFVCFFGFVPDAEAAIGAGGATCTAQNKTASTTLGCTVATENFDAGNVAVMWFAGDNTATVDGNAQLLTSVTDSGGNAWTVTRCYTNSQASAGAGATTCVATARITTALTSGVSTITANFTSITAKAFVVKEFTVAAGKSLTLAFASDVANDAADPGAVSISSGFAPYDYLFVRSTAFERSSGGTWTTSTNYTTSGCNGTTGSAATDQEICGEFRIVTATSTAVSDPTATAVDNASTFIAFMETVTLSGTLYADEGVTAITAAQTIRAAVGTTSASSTTIYATTTTPTGSWTLQVGRLATSTPLVLWVDANTAIRASIFTKSSSTVNNISGLNLYQNRVILSHEGTSGTSTTNTDLAFYDGDNDVDIQYIANNGALTVKTNQELHITTGKTYDPGGAVLVHGNASSTSLTDGSLHLPANATYTAGASTTLAGSLKASSSATFTTHKNGLTFNATTTGKTIIAPFTTLGSTTFGGSGGGWTFASSATTSDLSIDAGTVTAPATHLAIRGDYTNSGTFAHNSGTVTFSSTTAAQTLSGTMVSGSAFNNIAFNGATHAVFSASASTSSFTITSTATVTAPIHLTVSGDFTNSGQFRTFGSWTEVGTPGTSEFSKMWSSVAYGNGRFVAVACGAGTAGCNETSTGNNRVMYSDDGMTWTTASSTRDIQWQEVTYGNGRFVAVANSNGGFWDTAMYSLDGVNWLEADVAGLLAEDVTYGNGRFVAVGGGGASVSFDGAVWTDYASGAGENIGYGNGLFVVTQQTAVNTLKTSPDGITWTTRTAAASQDWEDITYGNGLFVSIASQGNATDTVMTSPDGITWTGRTVTGYPTTGFAGRDWEEVVYGNGYFVAVNNDDTGSVKIMASADGVDWFLPNGAPTSYEMRSVTYGNGRFVEVSDWTGANNPNRVHDTTIRFSGTSAQTINGALTGASQFRRVIFSGAGTKTFTSTSASTTDFIIESGSGAVTAPTLLTIAGDYTNSGTFTAGSGTTTFSGRLPQTATGTMTGTSAFNNVEIEGETSKTFITNASSTDLLISGTTTVLEMPRHLSVSGDYMNTGQVNSLSQWVRASSTALNNWRAITYGNGLFVAVASSGADRIMTSPDGITWTARTAPEVNSWTAVTYGNGTFVAVSHDGTNRVMTSPDGINWTARAAAEANMWWSVTYGNGLFVATAVNGTNRIMTSPDGVTWTARAATQTNRWVSVTYGNGKFVSVAADGSSRVMISTDGITWSGQVAASVESWYKVAYGNGLFVAVSGTTTAREVSVASTSVMTSPDGITWTSRSGALRGSWNGLTYGNGLFMAVAATSTNASSSVMVSADGLSWQVSTTSSNRSWRGVGYGNNRFVITDLMGSVFVADDSMTTFNGSSAQSIGGNLDGSTFRNVAFNGAGTKTLVNNASTSNLTIYSGATVVAPTLLRISGDYTNNGTFTAGSGTTTFSSPYTQTATGTMTGTSAFYNLAINGGGVKRFLTNASTTNLTITGSTTALHIPPQLSISGNYIKTTGKTFDTSGWEIGSTSPNVDNWNGVTYANGRFVAVGNAISGEGVMTSLDGVTWTPRAAAQANTWQSVTYGEGLFVAVAYDGANRIMTSSDGVSWTPRTTPTVASYWQAITYGNGTFVATASNCIRTECVMTSPDGTSWATSTLPTSDFMNITGVTYGNGLFVGVGTSSIGGAFTSPDGITWTAWSTPGQETGGWWHDVTYGNGLFVAVNSGSTFGGTYAIMTSSDGMNWTGRVPGLVGKAWIAVTYGNGLFVAMNTDYPNGLVLYSIDGSNWATTTSPSEDNGWNDIAYGNGRLVAVAASSPWLTDMVMSSTMFGPDGTTTFNGTSQQVATGTLTGTSGFHNLQITNTSGAGSSTQSVLFGAKASSTGTFSMTASTSVRLPANATSTFQNIRLAGEAGQYTWLRSSVAGTRAGMYVPGSQQLLSYVNVRDNNACPTTMLATNGTSYDAGNNTCWDFYDLGFASAANQTFSMGQATTAISMITLVDDSPAVITAANDIRIRIATSTANMRWDTSDVTATFGGTASAKAANPVSYANGGTTLVVPISNDLAAGETLTISDLSFGNFISTSTAASSSLALYTGGAGDVTVDKWDTKTIGISGGLTLANHASGQVSDAFSNASEVDAELFAFRLTPSGENITVTSLAFRLQGVTGIVTANLTNARLYRDHNSNKVYDAGDTAVGGSGAVAINGQTGTVTFSTSFSATTSQNYLLIGDLTSLTGSDGLVVALTGDDIVGTGALTSLSVTENGTISNSQHMKVGQGGGGVGSEIGGAAPAGQTRSGGGNGGGDTADSNSGATIGNEPGFNPPTGNGSPFGTWTSGANAYSSDGLYATSAGQGSRHTYGLFGFNNVPGNSTITGVEVKLEASGSTAAGTISVRLSWDGGTSSTTLQTTGTLTGTDAVYTLGGPSNTWGHVWTPTELNNGSFVIEVVSNPSSNTIQLDAVQVRVYHQVSGGGGGGGGAVYKGQNRFFANVHSALGDRLFSFTDWLFGWMYR